MKASENQMEQGKTGERIVASLGPTRRFPAGSIVLLAFPALLPQGTLRGDERRGPATLALASHPIFLRSNRNVDCIVSDAGD